MARTKVTKQESREYIVTCDELRRFSVDYIVTATSEDEAREKAKRHEGEDAAQMVSVYSQDIRKVEVNE